jgi:hypothetical protein
MPEELPKFGIKIRKVAQTMPKLNSVVVEWLLALLNSPERRQQKDGFVG